jgi:hypothetical protein|tara:strand:- start:23607 stop:25772 length:2166 start_codon:yes stop_codon:yes gene_type:complete
MTSKIIKAALAVAKHYPVFPTYNKKPSWSNADLGVARGQGGYKIATQDPMKIKSLFAHQRAKEIAVPMGERTGMLCIDVDIYKNPALQDFIDAWPQLSKTKCHKTRSGGLHFFFRHPGADIKFPSTLQPGVDVKSSGTGYVCWPGTDGYEVIRKGPLAMFPLAMLEEAMKEKGGTGNITGSYNSESDQALIDRIVAGTDFYPALRTLSYRLPTRPQRFTEAQQIEILNGIMASSLAADGDHPRYFDWYDRVEKIPELVRSANEKHDEPLLPEEILLQGAKDQEKAFISEKVMIAATGRSVGPQRESTAADIEQKIKAGPSQPASSFTQFTAQSLNKTTIKPVEWIVPGMLPKQSTVSLAGTSNVGKTRWLAGYVMSLAVGDVGRMGLPPHQGKTREAHSTLWIANEEKVDDIARRLKAAARQHSVNTSAPIAVRGKDDGMLRLVALNEIGQPEIDEANVALIVSEARQLHASVIVFDPYVTLSDAIDENSAASASVLTKAFIMIASLTGAAVLHAHHTPKGSHSDPPDWYRADPGGWRGSGAIYSALDCAFTLSHWLPGDQNSRKAWRKNTIKHKLTRWIILDSAKIREGIAIDSVVYELVPQKMAKGEGDPIGVCRLATEHEAENALLDLAVDSLSAAAIGEALGRHLGVGRHESMSQVAKLMEGREFWPHPKTLKPAHKQELAEMFAEPVATDHYRVWIDVDDRETTTGKYAINIEERE